MKLRFHRTHAVPAKVAQDIRGIIAAEDIRFPGVRLPDIDLVLVAGWNYYGVLGNTFFERTITMIIDTKRPWRAIRRWAAPTFCHEIHHIGRFHTVGYGDRLSEAVVTEGLAVNYERERGWPAQTYGRKFSGSERQQILKTFQKESRRKDYGHPRWFFGAANLPRAAGYRLGTELVADYCKRTGAKPSELVATPASVILKNHPVLK